LERGHERRGKGGGKKIAWVDLDRRRSRDCRGGGIVMDSDVVPANVKVEGKEPPLLLIH
jgi:hypothetical protein